GGKLQLSSRAIDVQHDTRLLAPRRPDTEMHAAVELAFRAYGKSPSEGCIALCWGEARGSLRGGSGFAQRGAGHDAAPTRGGPPPPSVSDRSAGCVGRRGAFALRAPSRSRATPWAPHAPSRADTRARLSRRASVALRSTEHSSQGASSWALASE